MKNYLKHQYEDPTRLAEKRVGFILVCLCIAIMILFCVEAFAGEKEELSLEWRALVAEYNLAFERFKQTSPEFKNLREFHQKLNAKGFMFEKDTGKIIEKPEVEKPKVEKKSDGK